MKKLLMACLVCITLSNTICFADDENSNSQRIVLYNLALVQQNNNSLSRGAEIDESSAKMNLKLMMNVFGGRHNLSGNENAPIYLKVRRHSISIRFEWKF